MGGDFLQVLGKQKRDENNEVTMQKMCILRNGNGTSQFQATTDQLQTLRENTCLFSGVYTLSNVNQSALLFSPTGHIYFLTVALAFAQVQTTQENLVQVLLCKHLIPKDQVLIKPSKSLLLFLFNFTDEALYKLNHKMFSRYASLLMLTDSKQYTYG